MMLPMGVDGDRDVIIDEMETEHSEAVITEVVSRRSIPTAITPEVPSDPSVSGFKIPRTFVKSCTHTLLYSLLGGTTFVTLCFGFKSEMTVFQWHIVLSIIGYQLLMPYAIISIRSDGWASTLSYVHRRRAHWIMQVVGSLLAFIGSVIMMAHKATNFNSLHGKFALAALLFTIVSLANGVASLYTRQLRRCMPPRLSILSHTLIGTLAFLLSSVCLIYGYLKHAFREWATNEFTYFLIVLTCMYTAFICWSPTYKVAKQIFEAVKIKSLS